MEKQNQTFWQRIRHPYRLSLMDQSTWKSVWSIPLNGLGAVSVITLLFLLTIALLSVLIVYTPIRNILPGYSENIRQQLVEETMKVDSIGTEVELQKQYLSMVKQIMIGDIQSDSIRSLDSMQLVMRDRIQEAKQEATEEFLAQYEQKEKDNFQLFDIQETTPVYTLFCPVHGVITSSFSPDENRYGISLRTQEDVSVSSVLAGVVVHVDYEVDNTYTMVIQHVTYLSIYRHLSYVRKKMGESVQAGENIGMSSGQKELEFSLWHQGEVVNPEEVIVF